MQVLVVLLIGAFLVGCTDLGGWVRQRPAVLLALCTVAAASFYSLKVVL